MIEQRIVRRYATALFSAARKADMVDHIESDLGLVSYTFESLPALLDAISSPVIPASKKREIMQSIFKDKVHELTLSYLYLLIDKRREEAVMRTESEFVELANMARGIVPAEVTTAVELSMDQASALKARLDVVTGKSVVLKEIVNPEIIGGVIVRIDDTVIDGSVKGQLAALRERLLS